MLGSHRWLLLETRGRDDIAPNETGKRQPRTAADGNTERTVTAADGNAELPRTAADGKTERTIIAADGNAELPNLAATMT